MPTSKPWSKSATGFRVRADGDWMEADHVVLPLRPRMPARVLEALQPELSCLLEGIPYTSSITLALGYRKNTFDHPLIGHGFLVPGKERRTFRLHLGGQQVRQSRPRRHGSAALLYRRRGHVSQRRSRWWTAPATICAALMRMEAEPVFHNIARWPRCHGAIHRRPPTARRTD